MIRGERRNVDGSKEGRSGGKSESTDGRPPFRPEPKLRPRIKNLHRETPTVMGEKRVMVPLKLRKRNRG